MNFQQHQYNRAYRLFIRTKHKLQRSFNSGAWQQLSVQQKTALLKQFDKWRKRLYSLSIQLGKVAAAGVVLSLSQTVLAQSHQVSILDVSDQNEPHFFPSVATNGNGRCAIIWLNNNTNESYLSHVMVYDRAGNVVVPQRAIADSASFLTSGVGIDDDGDFEVASIEQFGEDSTNVYLTRFDQNGNQIAHFRVGPSGGYTLPGLATHADGHFIVSWQEIASDSIALLKAQQFNEDGSLLGSEILVDSSLADSGLATRLHILGSFRKWRVSQ